MPESPSFTAAANRARRPAFETPPMPRPRRPRLLLGLPVFAVFAAFGAIVWLAYQRGADVPPTGEPPLIKAPVTALKLPPDEAGAPAVADQGEVRDLLTDTPPGDQLERLLPSPEEPLTPEVASQTPAPDQSAGSTPAPTPPAATESGGGTPAPTPPTQTATAAQTPPPPPAAEATPPAQTASPPAQAASPPTQAATPPAQTASPPAPVASPPAQPASPAQVAARPATPPRQPPARVEQQTAAVKPPAPPAEPSSKEAEAALDALLAEVTQSAVPKPPPSDGLPPSRPPAASPGPPPTSTAALNPTPRPVQPAPQTPPASVSPFTRPGGQITAIAPDRPGSRPSNANTGAAPIIESAPNGNVAALEGSYRIQLAAVRDEADARRAWDLFLVDLGPVLQGVQPFIERADTANGTFYRVQVGPFASLQEAESLCDQLKQRNASCFVIRR